MYIIFIINAACPFFFRPGSFLKLVKTSWIERQILHANCFNFAFLSSCKNRRWQEISIGKEATGVICSEFTFYPQSFQLHVCESVHDKYAMACICSRMFVCIYVLACMLCLIWGCDALVLRRQEALVAPSWARSCLTMEECWRGHRASAFLSDAPHATHTLMKSYKHLQRCHKKKTKTKHAPPPPPALGAHAFHRRLTCEEGDSTYTDAASLLTVYTAVTCKFPGGPRGLYEGPGVLRLSFVKEPQGPCRGWLEHTWQFESLGRSAGITTNWLWRLAVSLRLEMVCCCAPCIGWGFGSHGGRKGFFRNQWGGW